MLFMITGMILGGKIVIELKRNEETGVVEAWENGEKIGEITTLGDEVKEDGRKVHESQGRTASRHKK